MLENTVKPAIRAALDVQGMAGLSAYLYGDDIAAAQGYPTAGLPYCAGYACGYHLVRCYLDATGADIAEDAAARRGHPAKKRRRRGSVRRPLRPVLGQQQVHHAAVAAHAVGLVVRLEVGVVGGVERLGSNTSQCSARWARSRRTAADSPEPIAFAASESTFLSADTALSYASK